MGRLPKIILMIAAMTAIFLWMSTAFNSCGERADDLLDDTDDTFTEIIDDTDEFVDDLGEDIFEGGESDDLFSDDDSDEDFYVAGDEAEETDFTSTDNTATSNYTESSNTSYSSAGQYMVIAGNYLVESNARNMTKKLSNLGYSNSEIGVFDRSQYHTVIASRHDNYGSAVEISNALKDRALIAMSKRDNFKN